MFLKEDRRFLPIQLSSMYADLIRLPQTSRLKSDNAFSTLTTTNTNIIEDIFTGGFDALALGYHSPTCRSFQSAL